MTTIQFTNTDNFLIRTDDLTYIEDWQATERSYKRQALQIVGKDCLRGLYASAKAVINLTDEWIKSV